MTTNEQGFTLIESLIVLSIFLIISLVTAFSIQPQYEDHICKQFITSFQADFLYGQQYAISHQQEINVVISPGQYYYYMRTSYNQPLLVMRNYSHSIDITSKTLPLSFKFTPSGNVSNFGSLSIKCGSRHYSMTVLIGKGRFYVVKE